MPVRQHMKTTRPRASLRQGRNDWYKIRNLADGPAEVIVYDEIGYFGVTAEDFISELRALDVDEITLRLNSPGGEIFDGIAIHNVLRSHQARVTTHVDGLAASIASVIAMAGDRIIMQPHSQMMIHDGSGLAIGNAADMREMAELLDRQSDNIASVYAERAGGTQKQWRAKMQAETWFTAAEALEAGLADEVAKRPRRSEDDEPAGQASWDLSVFRYPGREQAPAPANIAAPAAAATDTPVEDTAAPKHETPTTEGEWDGPAQEKKLPSPVPVATAKRVYAWYDADQAEDGAVPKTACKLPHHEVSSDGTPGAAVMAGARSALSRLPQTKGIPDDEKAAVEAHLRAHLADGGGGSEEDALPADAELTAWDPTVFRTSLARAAGDLTDWDPETFRTAMQAGTSQAHAEPPRAPTDGLPAAPPAPQAGDDPGPEPVRDWSGPDLLRAAIELQASNAPAPTVATPAQEPDPDPYDPTVVTRALREASR